MSLSTGYISCFVEKVRVVIEKRDVHDGIVGVVFDFAVERKFQRDGVRLEFRCMMNDDVSYRIEDGLCRCHEVRGREKFKYHELTDPESSRILLVNRLVLPHIVHVRNFTIPRSASVDARSQL